MTGRRAVGRDRRAVSTTLNYVLTLTIATLLVSGLLIAVSGYVADQRDQTVRNELKVIGQQLAGDMARADRMARTTRGSGPVVVSINRDLPNTVVGTTYGVEVVTGPPTDPPYLVLSTTDPSVSVQVELANQTVIADTAFGGGSIQIAYDAANDELEVTNSG